MHRNNVIALALLSLLVFASPAASQGVQVGTIAGVVSSPDGLSLPGVTITASSPGLQGERTAVSDVNGVYLLRSLPPGVYRVTFVLDSFRTVAREGVVVGVGDTASLDATMALAGVSETVTVTAPARLRPVNPTASETQAKRTVDALPIGRRPVDIAELAPGVTTNVFSAGQLTLGGAFGYDNVFMVNGVDVNDNVNGTSNNLFIEDAIQETAVRTHGISAQYGRFSGGVIDVVTRSGGNAFSGSFRESLGNPSWVAETPLQKQGNQQNPDLLGRTHEATFGGPIRHDRLWFFAAGRYERTNTANTFAQNGAAYTRTDTNARGEVKLTGRLASSQTLQGSVIANATEQANTTAVGAAALLDASTLTTRDLPNRLAVVKYDGAVTPNLFASLQYSQKQQGFRHNGGTSTAIVDSPFRTLGVTAGVPAGLFFNAPYLDANDPEDRNNQQLTGSLSYLWSSPRFGSHDLKSGVEHYVSTGIGGNSQSSTGYVFVTDYLTAGGAVVRDAAGSPVPTFIPGASQVWNFRAVRGAEVNLATTSFYVQDRWVATPRLMLDLGARVEVVRGDATGDITTVDNASIMPRLAATYDLRGDGRSIVYGTYGEYTGKHGQVQFAVNTNVGRPSEVDYVYTGPAGSGADFAPGFDIRNYTTVVYANFPTANVLVDDGIRAPLTREFTVAFGQEIGRRAHAKATYAWRTMSRFVEDFTDLDGGITDVPLVGALTNRVYANTSEPTREYQALMLQSGVRFGGRVSIDGHYTLQVRNHGSFPGEAANVPGATSIYGDYPEVFGSALDRLMPEGRLDNFQRHKLRVYGTYAQRLGRFGSVDVTPLWRVNSGAVYSLTSAVRVTPQQLVNNPGYPANNINSAVRQTVFFGERGAYDFKGYGVIDLAATYTLPVWRSLAPWFKLEMYNALNNQKQIAWDKTVTADPASALDANGLPTGYVQGARFGQATSGNQFPQPFLGQNGGRAVRLAFGVRF